VAVVALGYAGYQSSNPLCFSAGSTSHLAGEEVDGPMPEYWVPLGISIAALIAALAFVWSGEAERLTLPVTAS